MGGQRKVSYGNSHTAPSEGLGCAVVRGPARAEPARPNNDRSPRRPRSPGPEGHCLSVCPRDDARVPARRPARFTAQSSKPARRLPGHRNVIVWLPVKGPVYWKHTSFPMFGFLSLFSPFCFSQSAPPRPFGKGTELKILP